MLGVGFPFLSRKRPSGAAPPTVVSIAPAIGDVLGGDLVVIEVDDASGCVGATVDGVALSSFAIVDPTHVSGITGASGVNAAADVVVTNGIGPGTGVGLFHYYDPTAIWDLYLDGPDYSVVAGNGTWTARKGSNVSHATLAPAVGATLNGRATVDFDGATHILDGAATSGFVSSTGWGCFALANVDAVSTSTSPPYGNVGVWCDSEDYTGLHLDSTGPILQAYGFDVAARFASASFSLAQWEALQGRFDGVDLYARSGSGAWSAPAPCTTLGSALPTPLRVGSNYTGAALFDGRLAILALALAPPSDGDLAIFLSYVNARWGTAF